MARCVNCGTSLPRSSRADRRTCSARCRMALSRRLSVDEAEVRCAGCGEWQDECLCDAVGPEPTIHTHISGLTYGVLSGGGLFQQERPDIAEKFIGQPKGFGVQYVAELSRGDLARLEEHTRGYGELFSGPGMDPDDHQTRREGKAMLRDADRMREALTW